VTVISLDQVGEVLARHVPLYRRKAPVYQATMLTDLAHLWQGRHERVLDIGGGTGVIAEAIQRLLAVGEVVAVDVVDRYLPTLSVQTRVYDGRELPFDDASFDAATINNVIHHVPPQSRADLLREIARVVSGPIYIKDHIASSSLDHWRLAALDAIGNIPFGGQVDAQYLSMAEWEQLADAIGARVGAIRRSIYRNGPMAWLFPNRLEASFRFDRS
jgi:SAM-dependent methyltransferase